jgi:hypothetical protein
VITTSPNPRPNKGLPWQRLWQDEWLDEIQIEHIFDTGINRRRDWYPDSIYYQRKKFVVPSPFC